MTGLEPVTHGETRLDGRVWPGHGEFMNMIPIQRNGIML
jgi:hypothetical protein